MSLSPPTKMLQPEVSTYTKVRRITLPETYTVRRAVLYPDAEHKIHVPNDEAGIHFGAFLDHDISQEGIASDDATASSPVAVISIFYEHLPAHLAPLISHLNAVKFLRFRKFACLASCRARGIGSQVFQYVLDHARKAPELGPLTIVWCDARWSARDWYLKRGMVVLGDRFFKGDIEYIVVAIQVK